MKRRRRTCRRKPAVTVPAPTDDYIRKMAGSIGTNGNLLKALMAEKARAIVSTKFC